MRYDLNLTENDLLFLSATYLSYNFKKPKDYMNMVSCKPENYNQEAFDNYYDNKNILSEKDKKA